MRTGNMHIESDRPIGLNRPPEVSISVTNADGQHASTPLDYESYAREYRVVRIKCYDAAGQVVFLTLSDDLIWEIACGPLRMDLADGK